MIETPRTLPNPASSQNPRATPLKVTCVPMHEINTASISAWHPCGQVSPKSRRRRPFPVPARPQAPVPSRICSENLLNSFWHCVQSANGTVPLFATDGLIGVGGDRKGGNAAVALTCRDPALAGRNATHHRPAPPMAGRRFQKLLQSSFGVAQV